MVHVSAMMDSSWPRTGTACHAMEIVPRVLVLRSAHPVNLFGLELPVTSASSTTPLPLQAMTKFVYHVQLKD